MKPNRDNLPALLALISSDAAQEALAKRMDMIHQTHKAIRLGIRMSFDFPVWTWGASVIAVGTGNEARGQTKRMEFFGSPTAEHLLDGIAAWAGDGRMNEWLKQSEPYPIQQASDLYFAAGALAHDSDNSQFDKPRPKAVQEWLDKMKSTPVPREIVSRIYKAHLDASWKWANQLISEYKPTPSPPPPRNRTTP